MNDEKKILIIKLGPWDTLESSNIRALSMAKGFLELGYQVDWIGVKAAYVYPMLNKELIAFADRIRFIMLDNTDLHIGKRESGSKLHRSYHALCHKLISRISVYDFYKKSADTISGKVPFLGEYDYLVSISNPPTSHLAAKNLLSSGKIKASKWIEYWGDPIVGDVTERHKKNIMRQLKAEHSLLSGCDKVVFTSPATLKEEQARHREFADQMSVCPTPFLNRKLSEEDEVFTIGYYGAYRKHIINIEPFYRACLDLDAGFHVNIIGNSDRILAPTDTITVKGRSDVTDFEKRTDLYVCILPVKGGQIPGKVYQTAGSNRPVLVVLDGEYAEEQRTYLEGFGRYYFCENNEDDIRETIGKIVEEKKCWEPGRELEPTAAARRFLGQEIQ